MGTVQINRYVWLVNLLKRRSRLSLKEISDLWLHERNGDGKVIDKSRMNKWCNAISELFDYQIVNEKRGEYKYYIENEDALKNDSVREWLFNTMTVHNMLSNNVKLHGRILLESVSSDNKQLETILNAMNDSKMISFTYHSYWKDELEYLEVEPYCLKLAKRRWYVLSHCPQTNVTKAYPIDERIVDLKMLEDKPFKMPKDFSAEEYFSGYFGATAHEGSQQEHVKLKVCGTQVKYFDSLPLHHSQKKTYNCDEYSIFEYDVRPTYDFQQVILSHAPDVVVLEPQSLREEIKWKIEEMIKRYNV